MIPAVFDEMNAASYGAANTLRKQEALKRLDLYHDDQADYVFEALEQLFSDPSAMLQTHLNIVRKIINQLAMTYKAPPTRIIEGAGQDQERYNLMAEQCDLDVKLRQASRYLKLLKNVLIRPVWRNGAMALDVLTPNVIDVACDLSPEDLTDVLLTNYPTSGKLDEIEFSHWTAEFWRRLDYQGYTLEEEDNPYKILPFVSCFDYPPRDDFWLTGGQDLISLQISVNVKIVDLLHLLQMQAFGVGWIKGAPGGGQLKVDPGSLVELPEDGELGFASQKARISEMVSAIDKLVKWAVVSQGLSAASMSTDLTDRQSGTAKQLDQLEMNESRLEDTATWRKIEKELFAVMVAVWNYHNPRKKISTSAKLSTDFADPRPEADPKAQAEADDLRLGQGTLSPVDIIMRENPDIRTREDALAHLAKIREETRSLEA